MKFASVMIVALGLVLTSSATASAQGHQAPAASTLTPIGKRAFSSLFRGPHTGIRAAVAMPPASSSPTPQVLCGMTMVPADPNVDRHIHRGPAQSNPQPAVRKIHPRICRP